MDKMFNPIKIRQFQEDVEKSKEDLRYDWNNSLSINLFIFLKDV